MEQDLPFAGPRPPSSQHTLVHLLAAASPKAHQLRRILAGVLLTLGAASLVRATLSLDASLVYLKDFVQDYLWVRAVAAGTDPYRNVTDLAQQFFGFVPAGVFPHPNAHPPTTGLLMLPLAWLDYGAAATVWFALDLAFGLVAALLIGSATRFRLTVLGSLAVGVALFAWYPFHKELVLGQLSTLVLLLLCGTWLAFQRDRRGLAGVLLGLAIAIKPVPWPLLLVLAVRREWRALAGASAALGASALLALGLLGFDRLITYQEGLRAIGGLHRMEAQNMSLTTVGWRIFQGTHSTILTAISAPPLIDSPSLAALLGVIFPGAVLGLACLAAWRHRRLDVALGMMTCASLLVSPISWDHYLVIATLPIAILVDRIANGEMARGAVNLALLAAFALLLPVRTWMDFAIQIGGTGSGGLEVAFLPSLLTYVPTLGVGMLGFLLSPRFAPSESR